MYVSEYVYWGIILLLWILQGHSLYHMSVLYELINGTEDGVEKVIKRKALIHCGGPIIWLWTVLMPDRRVDSAK